MNTMENFYTEFRLGTQTVAPTITGFQGIKQCVKYLDSHPHKPIFILLIIRMVQISSDLHVAGIKLKTTQPRIFYTAIKTCITLELLTEEVRLCALFILFLALQSYGKYIFKQM